MADVFLVRGGHPVINFMWHKGDWARYKPPFANKTIPGSAPFDSHMDGAYGSGLGYFTMGMPLSPGAKHGAFEWQRKALEEGNPQVGDTLDMILVAHDHYCTYVNLKIDGCDPNLAGATFILAAKNYVDNGDGTYTPYAFPGVTAAFYAQGGAPIPMDVPYSGFISLTTVWNGYTFPLYSNPTISSCDPATPPSFGSCLVLGIQILSLPTDPNVNLWDMRNGLYMSAKVEGFECPTSC